MTPAAGLPSDGLFARNAWFHIASPTGASMTLPMTSQMQHHIPAFPALPAAAAHLHRPVYRGPSHAMTAVMSLRCSVAPPGHCVPGTPEPRPLPPYSYLYTVFSGTTTRQAPLAAASPWSPAALPVPVPASRLYRYRYGYAAGPLGVQRTPGSCSLRSVPVPSSCLSRYGYVAGYLREQRLVGHHCH